MYTATRGRGTILQSRVHVRRACAPDNVKPSQSCMQNLRAGNFTSWLAFSGRAWYTVNMQHTSRCFFLIEQNDIIRATTHSISSMLTFPFDRQTARRFMVTGFPVRHIRSPFVCPVFALARVFYEEDMVLSYSYVVDANQRNFEELLLIDMNSSASDVDNIIKYVYCNHKTLRVQHDREKRLVFFKASADCRRHLWTKSEWIQRRIRRACSGMAVNWQLDIRPRETTIYTFTDIQALWLFWMHLYTEEDPKFPRENIV